jgi:hypothetical protein
MRHVLGSEGALSKRETDGASNGIGAMLLQEIEHLVNVLHPGPLSSVDQLGGVLNDLTAEPEQLLSLVVPLGSLAADGGNHLGAMLGQNRFFSGIEESPMIGLMTTRDDPNSVSIKVKRARCCLAGFSLGRISRQIATAGRRSLGLRGAVEGLRSRREGERRKA